MKTKRGAKNIDQTDAAQLKKQASKFSKKTFVSPLKKFWPLYQEAVAATKAMTPEELAEDWEMKRQQRLDSGANLHREPVAFISPKTGESIWI